MAGNTHKSFESLINLKKLDENDNTAAVHIDSDFSATFLEVKTYFHEYQ